MHRLAHLAVLAACLVGAPAAAAAEPAGALRQLAGTAGCLSQTGSAGACSDVRGVDGAQFVTVSPDGKHAYVAAVQSNAVAAFARGADGSLEQLPGADGCVAKTASDGCATGRALAVPDWVTFSDDGTSVYVASAESDATAVFSRDPVTGVLTQLPGAAGCVSSAASELSCTLGRALDLAAGVVLSPDGKNAYVASFNSDAIAVFARDPATGQLTQLSGQAGCVSQTVGSCAAGASMDGLAGVTVSPDGKHVYATARWSKAVTIYERDPATGALTRLAGTDGCVAAVGTASCAQGNGLPGPNTVVTSPDGAHVYVGSFDGSALAVFNRDAATGKLTQLPGDQGCFNGDGTQPACAPATALDGTFSLTQSPNGVSIYVAAYASDAVSVFARDSSTGALTQLEGTDGCVSRDGTGGLCATSALLDGAHHVAVDPDGRHAYAPANISDAVTLFDILPGDADPPETSVVSGPSGVTNGASPSFAFESSETGSTFECRLDGPGDAVGAYAPCSSPQAYGSLAEGAYVFSARATDPAGNVDPSPATRAFTLDTSAPDTSITSGPEGDTNDDAPSFTFESSEVGSSYECRLDGPDGAAGSFSSCSSPHGYDDLADGSYQFSVRAVDAAGNVDASHATRTFRVDGTAPETTITAGPSGEVTDRSPSFEFDSSEPGSSFECRLDGPGSASGTFEACSSPKSYEDLAAGNYVFSVRGADSVGNVDGSADTRRFTVVTPAADPAAPPAPRRPAPAPAAPSGEQAPSGAQAPTDVQPPATQLGFRLRPPAELAATLRRGLRTPVRCATACRIHVTAFVDRRTARSAGLARHFEGLSVGRGAARRGAAGESTVRVRFTRDARRRLRRLRRVRLMLRTTVTDSAGQATSRSHAVTLRRYRPRLGSALRRGLPLWLRCSVRCDAELRLVVHSRSARHLRLGRRSVVVASGAGDLGYGRYRVVRLRFTRAARRALRGERRVRFTVWVEVRGPTGATDAARRRIVLRR